MAEINTGLLPGVNLATVRQSPPTIYDTQQAMGAAGTALAGAQTAQQSADYQQLQIQRQNKARELAAQSLDPTTGQLDPERYKSNLVGAGLQPEAQEFHTQDMVNKEKKATAEKTINEVRVSNAQYGANLAEGFKKRHTADLEVIRTMPPESIEHQMADTRVNAALDIIMPELKATGVPVKPNMSIDDISETMDALTNLGQTVTEKQSKEIERTSAEATKLTAETGAYKGKLDAIGGLITALAGAKGTDAKTIEQQIVNARLSYSKVAKPADTMNDVIDFVTKFLTGSTGAANTGNTPSGNAPGVPLSQQAPQNTQGVPLSSMTSKTPIVPTVNKPVSGTTAPKASTGTIIDGQGNVIAKPTRAEKYAEQMYLHGKSINDIYTPNEKITQADKQDAMAAFAKMYPNESLDRIQTEKDYYKTIKPQLSSAETFQKTASKKSFLDALSKINLNTGILNSKLKDLRGIIGDVNVAAVKTDIGTLANEYSKVMAGSGGGTEGGRNEAQSLFSEDYSLGQIIKSIETAKENVNSRLETFYDQSGVNGDKERISADKRLGRLPVVSSARQEALIPKGEEFIVIENGQRIKHRKN